MANAAVPGTSLIAHVPVLVLAAMGCATRPAPPEPPDWPTSHAAWVGMQPEPARLALANPAEVRYHMRMHFQDLRTVEQLLVAGRLQE